MLCMMQNRMNNKDNLVVFDLDYTLINADSSTL